MFEVIPSPELAAGCVEVHCEHAVAVQPPAAALWSTPPALRPQPNLLADGQLPRPMGGERSPMGGTQRQVDQWEAVAGRVAGGAANGCEGSGRDGGGGTNWKKAGRREGERPPMGGRLLGGRANGNAAAAPAGWGALAGWRLAVREGKRRGGAAE